MNPIYLFVKKYQITKFGFIGSFVAIFLTCYFVFFAIYGEKGLQDLMRLQKEIEQKKVIENTLSNIRKSKEERVKKMRPESLDLDLLDEQVRKNLGYGDEDEIIIYDKKD